MSGLFSTPKPPKQRLGDIPQQTAQEGGARKIIYGRVRPINGNVIHVQKPIKRILKQKVSGSKKKAKVEHVYRTYAIGICEGPVSGISRIWRNNKLVYDARGNAWGQRNNGVFLKRFRLYLGHWQQMPDPTLESIWGVGNVPAYRGTCYMVAINEDLTEMTGALPQWVFEVERAETFDIETDLYPLSEQEKLSSSAVFCGGQLKGQPKFSDHLSSGAVFNGGQLKAILNQQAVGFESLESGATFNGGALKAILQTMTVGHEQITSGATFAGGTLKAILITQQADTEALASGAVFLGGTLQ